MAERGEGRTQNEQGCSLLVSFPHWGPISGL